MMVFRETIFCSVYQSKTCSENTPANGHFSNKFRCFDKIIRKRISKLYLLRVYKPEKLVINLCVKLLPLIYFHKPRKSS